MKRRTALKSIGAALTLSMMPANIAFGTQHRLKGYLRTDWHKDPYALGSYSYLAKGSRQSDRRALEKPLHKRLYFAGEAVHPNYNSTVHAAHESGLRAAEFAHEDEHQNIAIIGAGMAGLSAAHQLHNQEHKITLIEARDRIGGRILTDQSLGVPLDLGASWIHGTTDNPLTDLAKQANQTTLLTDDTYTTRGSDGRPLRDDETPDWLEEVTEIQHNAGADADQINSLGYLFQDDYDGDEVIFEKGYGPLLDQFQGDYELILNSPVQEIAYDEGGVTLVTSKGQARYDAVIITLPLGVLKSQSVRFKPPLPRKKQRAIDRLGMGTLDKVYLLFDKVFWDDETWILTPENGFEHGHFNQWLNLDRYLGAPIIMAFNGGTPALQLSDLSDDEIIERALQTLATAYPV